MRRLSTEQVLNEEDQFMLDYLKRKYPEAAADL